MTADILAAVALTLQVALTATLLAGIPGTLLAYVLARRSFRGKHLVSTVLLLPLVLPPTAVGYLLLRLLSPDLLGFDPGILLTWKAAVAAASVMALPLIVRTARVTFEQVDPRLEGMARTLGHGPVAVWFRFTLPLAGRGLVAAAILGFTRAVGEFGATVTVAGNIPGRTRTLASAIFSAQQSGRDGEATVLLLLAVGLGFTAVLASEVLVRGGRRAR